jgi:hypothetical protein
VYVICKCIIVNVSVPKHLAVSVGLHTLPNEQRGNYSVCGHVCVT